MLILPSDKFLAGRLRSNTSSMAPRPPCFCLYTQDTSPKQAFSVCGVIKQPRNPNGPPYTAEYPPNNLGYAFNKSIRTLYRYTLNDLGFRLIWVSFFLVASAMISLSLASSSRASVTYLLGSTLENLSGLLYARSMA